jgi:hypothetical protein
MLALRTVDPHGRCCVNHDGVGGCVCRACCHRHEPRVEAGGVGVERNRLAWLIECGLGDGVVGGCELELNHISLCSDDVVGEVC